MSEYYLSVFEAWEITLQLRIEEEKRKKPPIVSTALIVLASMYSGLSPDKEYKLFKAMVSLIQEERPKKIKVDEDDLDQLAAILLVAAEVRRQNE